LNLSRRVTCDERSSIVMEKCGLLTSAIHCE
jgi:hypothetical protein